MKRFFTAFVVMLFAIGLVFGQAPKIILITPDDRDDAQYEFLVRNGFDVEKFYPGDALSAAGQDTIDMLNAADLIIVGRSPLSGTFDGDDEPVWNGLTAPLIINSQFVARSSRIKMFNSTTAYFEDAKPAIAYGSVLVPGDPVFADATLMGDSIGWCIAPHSFVENNDSATNGTIMAVYNGTTPLFARWDAGVEYYPGAGAIPAGPRTYFGFGNDANELNFFPLTREAKQIYLAEVCRMTGVAVTDALFGIEDIKVILYTDDNDDDEQYEWLMNQGFYLLSKFYAGDELSKAGQDTIDMLNAADLVIVGRSPNSGTFDGDDEPVWNALTAPLIINSQFVARSSRLKMFNSTTAYIQNEGPATAYGSILVPGDPAFVNATIVGDSMGWCVAPHSFVENSDSATNGTILAVYNGTSPLYARWDAGTEYYPGAGAIPAGPRTYFGFGNDANEVNFFPLTREVKQVYLSEICMIAGVDAAQVPDAKFTASDASVIFITDDEEDDPQIEWLRKNNVKVTKFYPGPSLAAAGQDTIDMLNAAELIIVGRSPNSGEFDEEDETAWNALTAPLILNSQWVARSSRMKWFNSTTVSIQNEAPVMAYATSDMPEDDILTFNVNFGDSLAWCLPPHCFLENNDSANNGTMVAMFNTYRPLLARWDAGTEYYPGAGATAAGPRTYFGIGNDAPYSSNFFPLTNESQQVYFNEICRMLDVEMNVVMTVSSDASLASLEYDVADATLTPAFDKSTMMYSLTLVEGSSVVNLTGTSSNPYATVVGNGSIDVSAGEEITTTIEVTAENGAMMFYTITVVPYVEVIGIESEEQASMMTKLYPNPVTDILHVESEMRISHVTVFNVLGKVVIEQTGLQSERVNLNVDTLEPGLYMIRVDNGIESTRSKFLKR